MRRALGVVAGCALLIVGCAPSATTSDTMSDTKPDWLVRADSVRSTPAELRGLADLAAGGDDAAAATIGMAGLRGLGRADGGTVPAAGEFSSAAAVVPAGSWKGLQSVGPFLSATTPRWPTRSLDFRIRSQLHATARDDAHTWIEMLLATVDELQDYFEPAYVQLPTGVHFGVDFLHDRVTGMEETWVTSAPLPDPHGLHTYRLTIDGDTGELVLSIDDVVFDSTILPVDDFSITAPPVGHPLWMARRTVGVEWMELRDGTDDTLVHSFDLAGSVDGALAVTTRGETWTSASGMVLAPWGDGPRLISSGTGNHEVVDTDLMDIGADESFTWSVRWRVWGDAATRFSGATGWWHRYGTSDPSTSPGWGVASFPSLGVDYGFLIGSGGEPVTVDAGTVPSREHVLTTRLDRQDHSLSLWIDGIEVDAADATALGAVTSASPASLLGFGATGDAKWFAMWRRALSDDEIRSVAAG